jgi:ankyrin repeat protein
MMSRTLPERANLEFLSKEAKTLLQRVKAGDADALERLRTSGPPDVVDPKLVDCQHALAREYGFASWPRLRAHVEALHAIDPLDALGAAIRSRTTTEVATVLQRFPSLRTKLDEPLRGGSFGATPLIAAVEQSNREMIDLLLAHGATINQRSHWWAGGFQVLENDHGLADFLIVRGAVLDANSASKLGRLEDLRRLVESDPAAVNRRGGDGQTPLHVAPTVDIARFLIDHGADIDALDVDHESTAAQYLIRSHPEVSRYLVERGAKADFLLAVALGDLARVRAILDADPAAINTVVSPRYFPKRNHHAGGHIYTWTLGQGKSAHLIAQEFGHPEVLRLLLERTPSHLKLAAACEVGDDPLIHRLLIEDPSLAATLSKELKSRLPMAAQQSQVEAVRRMLKAGWPVDAVGQHGATALHWAGFHGNPDLAHAILPFAPPLEAREADFGQTPLQWTIYGSLNGWYADRGDYAAVAELLLQAGSKAPPLSEVKATEAVLAVLRRQAGAPPGGKQR